MNLKVVIKEEIQSILNEGKGELVDYFSNMWSKDQNVINTINSSYYLKTKYGHYLAYGPEEWNMMDYDDLMKIWNAWDVDYLTKGRNLNEAKKVDPSLAKLILQMLKDLEEPIEETAKQLSEEIMVDLTAHYENDTPLDGKTYTFTPKEDYLNPYELEVGFKHTSSGSFIGYSDEHYIEVRFAYKKSSEFERYGMGMARLPKIHNDLYHIIKHECSHFYLKTKDLPELLYYTHPDGIKKYYSDDQEMVLHSREIFDRLVQTKPNWKELDDERLMKIVAREVKNLPNHTNIPAPLGAGLQKKYVSFIMKNYIIPNK